MSHTLNERLRRRCPQSWREITLPEGTRALLLAPHPDDFDAVGVTMRLLHQRACSLRVAVAHTGSGVETSYCSPPTLERMRQIREEEQRASCRFFGLAEKDLLFMELDNDSDDQPKNCEANLGILREVVGDACPDMVFMPHGHDTNSGHRTMYAMARHLLSEVNRPLTLCLIRDPKTIASRLDLYTPFEKEEAEWKRQLLRFHESQQQRNLNMRGHGFDDRLLATNESVARELDLDAPWAEGFELQIYE